MHSTRDILNLWKTTLCKFKDDFPEYDALLKANGWQAGVREKKNKSFGWADNREKRVIINWHLHKNSEEQHIVDTMLHEIAHAIDFCQRGRSDHSAVWKRIVQEIGAIPKAVSKRSVKTEYPWVMALILEDQVRFIKGYNRRPSRQKPNSVMWGTYLSKDKDGTIDKLWLLSWEEWLKKCNAMGISPYYEDRK